MATTSTGVSELFKGGKPKVYKGAPKHKVKVINQTKRTKRTK
jgi:hypothetical protein